MPPKGCWCEWSRMQAAHLHLRTHTCVQDSHHTRRSTLNAHFHLCSHTHTYNASMHTCAYIHTSTMHAYTLFTCHCRVGQNHIYTMHIRYSWQGNYQIYGHLRRIYMVLANSMSLDNRHKLAPWYHDHHDHTG